MNGRRFWDVTVIWCCASNIQTFAVQPTERWGMYGWFIVVGGIVVIISKYFQRDAF
jgi:hypothetical protein